MKLFQSTQPKRAATFGCRRTGRARCKFQSTQPKRAATAGSSQSGATETISIHAAQEGCDKMSDIFVLKIVNFNPRSPRGLRLYGTLGHAILVLFQSTQPKRAATNWRRHNGTAAVDFNPRSPRGLRPARKRAPARKFEFQSTQPKRAATTRRRRMADKVIISIHAAQEGCDNALERLQEQTEGISIHAAQEGCDRSVGIYAPMSILFQSTQPKRAATTQPRVWKVVVIFQSTQPKRAATLYIITCTVYCIYFNPRSPRGLRLNPMM